MKKSITPNQIKQNNKKLIYQYIYNNTSVSQQDICFSLGLSRPTVTSNLAELEACGMIVKNGQISTEYVGRKASAYSISADYKISIGVEILIDEIKIIAIDLYGNKLNNAVQKIIYKNNDSYFKNVCDMIIAFINTLDILPEQILGIGFAMQALISPDGSTVMYGKILDCTGLSVSLFSKHLPFTCRFFHDADCAALSELWVSPELENGFYISVSRHLGAAIIHKGKIISGKHGHNATIEHIQMKSKGDVCYCGKKGCMDTLCSIDALLKKNESLKSFFSKLRSSEADTYKRWDDFLTDLAASINMLHLIYDTDFIIGGYLAPYLCEDDIAVLHKKISKLTPFSESDDFIHIGKMAENNITIGAALPYIKDFLNKENM